MNRYRNWFLLFAWIAGSILVGARNVLMNFEPELALHLIEEEAITISNLVPTMASLLTTVPTLESYDLSSLRECGDPRMGRME